MTRLKTVGIWLLQILTAFLMVAAGSQKFTSAPVWERMFRTWGYPDHFYLVIGAVEVVAGIGLLVPKIASVSALTLVVVMFSAAITQICAAAATALANWCSVPWSPSSHMRDGATPRGSHAQWCARLRNCSPISTATSP